MRTFRVSRIQEARLLDAACERPADFDLASYWKASTTQFLESRRRLTITVRMEPAAADLLKQWCRAATILGPSSPADPWVTLKMDFDDEDQAAFTVLGFGPRIEVIAPTTLRHRIARDIATMAARQHDDAPV
jgi:predicted DNA-binding transcriptional regulator YafY